MLFCILFAIAQTPVMVVSLPFVKANTICKNNQNEADKTLFTTVCLSRMIKGYRPVKVYYAMYSRDGKEELIPLGIASFIYLNKDQVFARCELDVKPPKDIKEYVLNAKTYAGKNDYYISTSCIIEINNAELKLLILRPKEKAIIFE